MDARRYNIAQFLTSLHHSMNIPEMATSSHSLWWKVTNILPEFSTIPMYIVMYVTCLNCSENVVKKWVLTRILLQTILSTFDYNFDAKAFVNATIEEDAGISSFP